MTAEARQADRFARRVQSIVDQVVPRYAAAWGDGQHPGELEDWVEGVVQDVIARQVAARRHSVPPRCPSQDEVTAEADRLQRLADFLRVHGVEVICEVAAALEGQPATWS